jgi:dTDP-4-dehydrorhamnose 3,5-epimerase-like enzyme
VVAWDDPAIGIDWPITHPTLSRRDQEGMSLDAYRAKPAFHYTARE